MIQIDLPPMETTSAADLRQYLYRMINDLQRQLNQLEDRIAEIEMRKENNNAT